MGGEDLLSYALASVFQEPLTPAVELCFDRIRRLSSAESESEKKLAALNGCWKNTEGVACTVSGNQCTFDTAKPGTFPIDVKDGFCSLNGWVAITVSPQTILWQKAGRMMEWHRAADSTATGNGVVAPATATKPPPKAIDKRPKDDAKEKKAKEEAERKAKLEAEQK